MQAATPCCSVTATHGSALYNEHRICADHVAKGWQIVTDPRTGKDVLDAARIGRDPDCGCVRTTLYQVVLQKCPTHTIGPMACCPKASLTACVCMYSYTCPDHGVQHIGTHN